MIGIRIKTLTLLFLSIASCSLILSVIMINLTYSNLQNQVQDKLTILTDKTEKEIEIDNLPIEDGVDDISNLVTSTFNIQEASENPAVYLPNYLNSIGPQVKNMIQDAKGSIGGYVYPNVEIYKGIYDVWYVLENGTFVKTDKQESAEMFYPTNDSMIWYYAPILEKKPLWTHVYFDEMLKENCISYVKPIIIDNVVVGMTGIDASFKTKGDTVDKIKIFSNGFAFLLDDNLEFITQPKKGNTISKTDFERIHQEIKKTNKGIIEITDYFISYKKLTNNQTLIITAPKKEVMEPINKIIVWMLLTTLFITITVMLVGFIISKSIVDPLEKLKGYANRLGSGHFDEPVLVKSNDEVGKLADSFEKLRISILEQNKQLAKYGQDLETKVKERTIELENKNRELEKMNAITINREIKMIELKNQIKELESKVSQK